MSSGWRWISALAAIVLLVAIAIGVAVAAAWSSLPLDQATLVIDGETVALPRAERLAGGAGADARRCSRSCVAAPDRASRSRVAAAALGIAVGARSSSP